MFYTNTKVRKEASASYFKVRYVITRYSPRKLNKTKKMLGQSSKFLGPDSEWIPPE
jgi:hypothetical protein